MGKPGRKHRLFFSSGIDEISNLGLLRSQAEVIAFIDER
jgi:hypothetical protein